MKQKIIPERKTNYSSSGEGEALIFIHGVGLDHTMWCSQISYFSNYYKVYAFDMLGHGNSQKLDQSQYTLKDFTEQLYDFCNRLDIKNAHIIGFSMGGMVAQHFSICYPQMVKTLTIANSVANRTEKETNAILDRVKMVEKNGKNATIDAAIKRWFTNDYVNTKQEIIVKIKERLKQNDEKSYLNAYRVFAMSDKQLWGKLEYIKVPTFIITGENDVGSNPRMANQMHDKIVNSEVCIVPLARHMLPVEMPELFNKHLHEFLKRFK